MKTAVVTGASSGIGLAISQYLVGKGIKVFGIARRFENACQNSEDICKITGRRDSPMFIKVKCDISNVEELVQCIKIISQNERINILVNCAGIGIFGPHEQLNPFTINQMVSVNLTAPLIITNLLLRRLKETRGIIINISSTAAKKISTHGCAYAATKAGLSHFSDSLFHEVRKTGVRVVTICPDITKTEFYNNADFKEYDDEQCFLFAEDIVKAVDFVLSCRHGAVAKELILMPQKFRIERKKE